MFKNRRKLETPDSGNSPNSNRQLKRIRRTKLLDGIRTPNSTIPPDWGDADCSIFSDIIIPKELIELNNAENSNSNEFNESLVTPSQQFLADVVSSTDNKLIVENLDLKKFYSESQYLTKDEIKLKSNQNNMNSTKLELQSIADISWNSQYFNDEEIIKDFYGLPENVEKLIQNYKGIKELYDWQKECLNLPAVRNRTNLIYALPTSGGKTLVSEILMLREVVTRKKNVIFVLPYVSIVQEKVSALAPFALNLNFLIEEYTAGKGKCPPLKRRRLSSIYIASIEKASILFDSLIESERTNEIGLIVVDELHLIGEKNRGATLEGFLTKVLYSKADIQIVAMSATIGNLSEISTFLNADVYTRGFRPVDLKEYLKFGSDLLEINPNAQCAEDLFTASRSVNFKYSDSVARADPDHLAGLVAEIAPIESCLIFCASKKNCENVAILLTKILPRKKFAEFRKKEKLDLMDAITKLCNDLNPILAQTIPFGIAYHHSGLTTDERKLLEQGYRSGAICIICCTSTLAAGVNLPAKRVIIRAPYIGNKLMTLCQYKQMAGRAGRAGMVANNCGESILICGSKNNNPVRDMLFSPMDKVVSSLVENDSVGLQALIISGIGLKLASTFVDIQKLLSKTLLAVQNEQTFDLTMRDLLVKNINLLCKHKIIKHIGPPLKTVNSIDNAQQNELKKKSLVFSQGFDLASGQSNLSSDTDQLESSSKSKLSSKKLILGRNMEFQLTTIGRAALKAGIDYHRTEKIYYELKKSQESLVLRNYSHLLYLVVAFIVSDENADIVTSSIDVHVFYDLLNNLDDGTRHLIRVIGIKESHIVKMRKNMTIRGQVEIQLNRLYKVLILIDVLNLHPIHIISNKFFCDRGNIQTLISQTITGANMLTRLCEEIDEFWSFKALFERVCEKLDRCGTNEIIELLELPAVKINRAKQLYNAGFKTIADVAKSRPSKLSKSIEHMPYRTANEIISAAQLILKQKLETLQDQSEDIIACLGGSVELRGFQN